MTTIMGQYKTLSKVVQDRAMADRMAMSDPTSKEYKDNYGKMVDLFVKADDNHNGVLERGEFHVFSKLVEDHKKSKYGDSVKQDEATINAQYNLINNWAPEKEGLAFGDIVRSWKC